MDKIIELETVDAFIRYGNWVRYEFTTKEDVYVEEMGDSTDIFGIEISDDGDASVLVVGSDSYAVHEDVTHLFDVDRIIDDCKKVDSNEIDHTEFYVDWLKQEEEEELN